MPTIRFEDREIDCPEGANLRMVLVRARVPLYNSVAKALNCRGAGRCGTCAVRVEGKVSEPTSAEQKRLRQFPHSQDAGLRLACQCSVLGDLTISKQRGLFGQVADDGA